MGDDGMEVDRDFNYLGSKVNNNNGVLQEIRNMVAGHSIRLNSVKGSELGQPKSKRILYKTVIRPFVTLGCDPWTFRKSLKEMLGIFDRRVALLGKFWLS